MGHYRRSLTWAAAWGDPALWVASAGGVGCAPRAPGTWGTLVGVPIAWALASLPWPLHLFAIGLAFALGIWASRRAMEFVGQADPQFVVWDEVVGYLVTMFAVPWSWTAAVVGFALFRLFDVLKPGPIRWVERVAPGAYGILLDDVVAGLVASVCLQIILFYII